MASLGELERTVLEHLWTASAPVAATEVRDALADRELALTTVHTVLSRLEAKGVVRHTAGRPRLFAAVATREEHAAALMREVLGAAADRQAVLARFVGGVDPDEARMLRELLAGTDDAAPR